MTQTYLPLSKITHSLRLARFNRDHFPLDFRTLVRLRVTASSNTACLKFHQHCSCRNFRQSYLSAHQQNTSLVVSVKLSPRPPMALLSVKWTDGYHLRILRSPRIRAAHDYMISNLPCTLRRMYHCRFATASRTPAAALNAIWELAADAKPPPSSVDNRLLQWKRGGSVMIGITRLNVSPQFCRRYTHTTRALLTKMIA